MIPEAIIKRWPGSGEPDEKRLRDLMASEGLQPYRWSNGPYDFYAAHTHPYNKVIYVVSGSIVFGLPEASREPAGSGKLELHAGDRLYLPAQTVHDAAVGPKGVVCLEAHC